MGYSAVIIRHVFAAGIASLAMFAGTPHGSAAEYPNQPIKIVVPYTPGTGYDTIARSIGPKLSERLGQPVVVENKPGASSTIGAAQVAKAAPDGYTLVMIGEGTVAASFLYPDPGYDTVKDFEPISLAGYGTLMVVTNPMTGIKTLDDFIKAAKAKPGKFNYASPGTGTSQHLKMEMFKSAADIDIVHVPYKGSAPALNDLLGGQVDFALVPVHQALTHVQAGKLVPLAIISPERSQKVPNVPTLKEAGFQGVDANMWYAIMAPKKTPSAIVSKLSAEIAGILKSPDTKKTIEASGIDVVGADGKVLTGIIANEAVTSSDIIKKNKIVLE